MTTLDSRALDAGFTQYRRSQITELKPWTPGDDMSRISVSAPDKEAGSPKPGDMIARNPKNHDVQWLVAATYFADNFEAALASPQPALAVKGLNDEMVENMVRRFLQWKLPENFSPDGGISFNKVSNAGTSYEYRHEPVGTNLFDFGQATEMVRHMLDGLALSVAPATADGWREQPWMGNEAKTKARWDTHDEAMNIVLSAGTVTTLSYEETALIYARARGFVIDDAELMGSPLPAAPTATGGR